MSKFNPVVAISGANRGLGKALCREFASNGYTVVALVRRGEVVEEFRNEMLTEGVSVQTVQCDVTQDQQCKQAISMIAHHYGKLNILINNAGVTHISEFGGIDDFDKLQQVMDVNFFGAVRLTAYAKELLTFTRGSLVNISSVAGYAPVHGRTAYSASKFAMEGFFRTLATELQDRGVHHMMVHPTFIDTGIRKDQEDFKTTGEVLTAEYCAKEIYKGVLKKKRTLLIGKTAKKAFWAYKLLPKVYERMMLKGMKKERS